MNSKSVHNRQNLESTKVRIIRWMDKENVVCIYRRILCSHKEELNSSICHQNVAIKDTTLSDTSRKTNISCPSLHMGAKI